MVDLTLDQEVDPMLRIILMFQIIRFVGIIFNLELKLKNE